MLTCSHFVAGLNEYLDNELDTAARVRLDRHAGNCPRCRIVLETTRKTIELYKTFLPCRFSPALESRLMDALRTRMGTN
jgi:anti-sigma factor RsiW